MNKKILLGSIIAVAILVLVSFTGVVGYQTTKSSTITKSSPVFTIRTNRAIGEESKDIACDYVGKGEETTLSFPTSNSRNTQMQRVIDIISRMDDKTFNRFVKLFVYQANNNNKMKDINNNAISDALYQIRDNSKLLKNHFIVGKNDDSLYTKGPCATFWCPTYTPICLFTAIGELPACIIEILWIIIAFGIILIWGGINRWLPILCVLPSIETFN